MTRTISQTRMARLIVLTLLAALLGLSMASGARAEYTPSSLVSYVGEDQAQDAFDPAISADGRYVAFTGTFDGVSGIYRKDLDSGGLELVAGADSADPAISAPDAGAPSISSDGRYVSFTTTAALDPEDDPGGGCSSVYVRDMGIPASSSGAYILASALNGSTQGLTYEGTGAGGCPGGGSAAAGRVALSADGQEVAFTVIGASDLTGACTASGGSSPVSCPTPPAQVAVRDIATDTTTLVSETVGSLGGAPEPVPGGAAYTDGAPESPIGSSSAAISADGTTVAWMGVDIPSQAPASSAPIGAGGDTPPVYPDEYVEPLWRRIADGPDAPTRRITGGDDPLCGCAGPLATDYDPGSTEPEQAGPQWGTYISIQSATPQPQFLFPNITPQLSANGQTVAILSTAPDIDQQAELEAQHVSKSYYLTANAFVVNMATGLTRVQALTRVTEWASGNFNDAASDGKVEDISISPDGSEVAFTTERIDFPLSPPALVTPALEQGVSSQLYVVDLSTGSLALVSYGYDGQPADAAVSSPSFAGDEGHTLAFASGATNLVYGAYNKAQDDVFVTSEINSPLVAGVDSIGPMPANPIAAKRWEILLATHPEKDGSVLLYVTVPGAGSLKATAKAQVPVVVTEKIKGKAKKKSKGGAKSAAARRSVTRKHTVIAARVVGSAKGTPTEPGLVELRLASPKADRSLEEAHNGLYATITVTFAAHGHSTVTGVAQVTFRRSPAKKSSKASSEAKKSAKSSARAGEKAAAGGRPGGGGG